MPLQFRVPPQPRTSSLPSTDTSNSVNKDLESEHESLADRLLQDIDDNLTQRPIHFRFLRTCIGFMTLFLVLFCGRRIIEESYGIRANGRSKTVKNELSTATNSTISIKDKTLEAHTTSQAISPRSKYLKLAMLISFPNSGTSFTLATVRSASNSKVAGTACLDNTDAFDPVYRSKPRRGPHYIPNETHQHHLARPRKYILTKTHCAGYDNAPMTSPVSYLVPRQNFIKECHKTCSPERSEVEPDGVAWNKFYFNESLVGSFVHLLRDPFDNIVSRWHCHLNGIETKYPEEISKYSKTAEGFQKFCADRDAYYLLNEAPYLARELVESGEGVPCRTDFLRYVQWHNHAFAMTGKLRKPVHILHYQDFRDDYNGTMSKLLDFLELPFASDGESFRWSDYSDYYTAEQRRVIKRFVKHLASSETLNALTRYGFD